MDRPAEHEQRRPVPLLIIVIRRRPPLSGRFPAAWLTPERAPWKQKEGR